jgi:hypothetical protein
MSSSQKNAENIPYMSKGVSNKEYPTDGFF